ncbi:MAG: hypothetical protein ABI559_11030 [Chloroflexota bacterium]
MKTLARILGGAVLMTLAIAAACGGSDSPTASPSDSATPSPTPTLSPNIRTPGPTSSPPVTDYRLIYREYTAQEDVIWSAPLDAPDQREEVLRIAHRDGYGVKAVLSPDSTYLAYLSLPENAVSTDSSQGEAYVIDLASTDREPTLLAAGIDYNYTPLWSPDSHLLYMRQYAGPEFLAANVIIVRVAVSRVDPKAKTPTPTPTLAPGIAPAPTVDPVEVVLKDSVAHVLSFAPIGFSDDKKSMFFVQEEGGTEGATLVGIYSPATTDAVDAFHKGVESSWYDAQRANQQAIDDANANGQPLPETTITPVPSPVPDSRFVVQLSDQAAFDCALSGDQHKVAYLSQAFDDNGEIHNELFVADIVEATANPFGVGGVSGGDFLRPVWHPDGRLTAGLLSATGGPGQIIVAALDGSDLQYLVQPASGFDSPISWAPDGSWLAVQHNDGSSLANPGASHVELVASTGQRLVVPSTDNGTEDSVVGWAKVDAIPTPAP